MKKGGRGAASMAGKGGNRKRKPTNQITTGSIRNPSFHGAGRINVRLPDVKQAEGGSIKEETERLDRKRHHRQDEQRVEGQ